MSTGRFHFPYMLRGGLLPLLLAVVCGCSHAPDAAADKAEHGEPDEAAAVEVQTVPAAERTIDEVVPAIGRSEALPNRLVTLTPAVAGHVHEIAVCVGDAVHRGDVIVRLDTVVASADAAEKEAQRNTLQAALDLLVAPPRPEDRRALEIAVDQAKVAVKRAEAVLERLQPLRARNELPAAQAFEAEQMLADARLRQQAAEAQLQLLVLGPRPEAVAEAKARLAAAEQLLAGVRAHLALHELRSPIDGVVDSLNCHPGQAISAGTVVAEIVDPSELYITAWLPVRVAEKIKPGQAATITLGDEAPPAAAAEEHDEAAHGAASAEKKPEPDEKHESAGASAAEKKPEAEEKHESESTPAADKQPAAETAAATPEAGEGTAGEQLPAAKVVSVGRIVDPQTGNLPVRVMLDNSAGRVAVGQTVSLAIVSGTTEKALVVPARALFDLGEGPLLIVVREGKIVHLHPESAENHGEWTVITGTDLQPGERVVVDGGFNLPEETPVKEGPSRAAVAEAES